MHSGEKFKLEYQENLLLANKDHSRSRLGITATDRSDLILIFCLFFPTCPISHMNQEIKSVFKPATTIRACMAWFLATFYSHVAS